MCDALSKASLIGFTGKPTQSGEENTQAVFGNWADSLLFLKPHFSLRYQTG
jgi:type I site-specific restriction-modification system R (restriction) subunit